MAQADDEVGKLRRGFNRVARDLDRAFAVAWFSPSQHFLIEQAREASWRLASKEAEPFALPLSRLARIAGRNRTNLSDALRDLVAGRVFLQGEDGSLRINKDYRDWADSRGRPRLSGEQLAWCQEARLPSGSVGKNRHAPVGKNRHPAEPIVTNGAVNGSHLSGKTDRPEPLTAHPLSGKTDSFDVPPGPPIEERAGPRVRQKTLEIKREEDSPCPPHTESTSLASEPSARAGGDGAPAEAPPIHAPTEPSHGGGVLFPTLREVAVWADRLPGHELAALGPWVESVGALYPPAWVRLAVAEALSADPRRIKLYAHACLKRWHAVGGPPDLGAIERAERDRRAAAANARTPEVEPERPELRPLRDPSLPPAVAKVYVPRAGRPKRPGVGT